MSRLLTIRNRQRVRRVDPKALRRLTRHLLSVQLGAPSFDLCLHLVDAREMARVNHQFLQHPGSTDVITFDHSDPPDPAQCAPKPHARGWLTGHTRAQDLQGELFLSLDDAVAQARVFRTTWQAELARYIVHGFLHLTGHDDRAPSDRRRMKRVENRLVVALAREFPLAALERTAVPCRPSRRPRGPRPAPSKPSGPARNPPKSPSGRKPRA